MITKITNEIDKWKQNNGGQCPMLSDLAVLLGCDQTDLKSYLMDAERLGIIYEPQVSHYDYHHDMTYRFC